MPFATSRRTPAGNQFASVSCGVNIKLLPGIEQQIKVSLGNSDFAVTSSGQAFPRPKYYHKYESRLKKLQRKLWKKQRGRSNWNGARQRAATPHDRVGNYRKILLHRVSFELMFGNPAIHLEDPERGSLLENYKLAKGVADAG